MASDSKVDLGEYEDFMNKSPVYDFNDPKSAHDRVLLVEGEKFYINIQYLAVWSDFFNGLANSGMKESEEEQITLKDVKADDFKNFLMIVYPMKFKITEDNVVSLVSLSYRFLAPRVLEKCKKFIDLNFETLDKIDLLLVAFQYDMNELKKKVADFIKIEVPVGPVRKCKDCSVQHGMQYCTKCDESSMVPFNSFIINKTSYVVKNKDRILALPADIKDFLLNIFLTCE